MVSTAEEAEASAKVGHNGRSKFYKGSENRFSSGLVDGFGEEREVTTKVVEFGSGESGWVSDHHGLYKEVGWWNWNHVVHGDLRRS